MMETFLNGVLLLCGLVIVFCVVLLVRNQIVYKVRFRVIEEPGFPERYRALGTYDSMLFDFRKWTYKQFTRGL